MLINFPPLKREGLIREGGGGLNRGFTVYRFWKRAVSSFCREKPCRYFAQGTGTCPFGSSCFYKHGKKRAVNQVLLHSIALVVSLAVVLSVVTQRRPSLLRDYTMSLDAIRLSFDINVILNLYSFVCHVRVWTGIS